MSGQIDTASAKHRTAVIVGRWQTPYLHEGHKHLINTACMHEGIRDLFIIIGCQEEVDERNPYTFKQRKDMILKEYPMALIGIIWDVKDDNIEWSRKLDEMIEQMDRPLLFGSRDSFHQHYKGRFKYQPVDEIPGVSATKIREVMATKLISPNMPFSPPDGTGLLAYCDYCLKPKPTEKRVFKLDGSDSKDIEPFIENFRNSLKQHEQQLKIIRDTMDDLDSIDSEYNLKYNIQNVYEDVDYPVRVGDNVTRIETKPKLTLFQRIKKWIGL